MEASRGFIRFSLELALQRLLETFVLPERGIALTDPRIEAHQAGMRFFMRRLMFDGDSGGGSLQ